MRALLRNCLASLATTIAVLSAGVPVVSLAAGPVHASAAVLGCPSGTHWDNTLQMCV